MNTLELLDRLQVLGAHVAIAGERVHVDAPAGALDDTLRTALRDHKVLIRAVLIGRGTGHALSPCSACGELSMVNVARPTMPTCRLTPGCEGRHQPRPADVPGITNRGVPKQAAPPRRTSKSRLLGDRAAWKGEAS